MKNPVQTFLIIFSSIFLTMGCRHMRPKGACAPMDGNPMPPRQRQFDDATARLQEQLALRNALIAATLGTHNPTVIPPPGGVPVIPIGGGIPGTIPVPPGGFPGAAGGFPAPGSSAISGAPVPVPIAGGAPAGWPAVPAGPGSVPFSDSAPARGQSGSTPVVPAASGIPDAGPSKVPTVVPVPVVPEGSWPAGAPAGPSAGGQTPVAGQMPASVPFGTLTDSSMAGRGIAARTDVVSVRSRAGGEVSPSPVRRRTVD